MSTKIPSEHEADETAQKRAQAEQFSFDIDVPGLVEVTNENHENPADHQYVVSIDDVTEDLLACTYPHHVHRNAYCKHMAAVENQPKRVHSTYSLRRTETMPNQRTAIVTVSDITDQRTLTEPPN